MTKQFAHAFIATNGPLMTEAIETIIGKRPETPDPIVRPLGVLESEAKRESGDGAGRTAPQTSGTGARVECDPENGAALSVRTAAAPAPFLFAAEGCEAFPHRAPHNVFGDDTPPRPQDIYDVEDAF
jgi:hypothetical protein